MFKPAVFSQESVFSGCHLMMRLKGVSRFIYIYYTVGFAGLHCFTLVMLGLFIACCSV